MKVIFDDGKEIEFDENEIALQDHRERIFKKDDIWYITKIINKDFAEWLDETKPMIIEEKKTPEKIIKLNNVSNASDLTALSQMQWENNKLIESKINEICDYLKSKGE